VTLENIKIVGMKYYNDLVNSIFIKDLDSLLIIDTGIKKGKDALLSEILKNDFKKFFVIITHGHPDHLGNNFMLKENFNPIFIANTCSKKMIEDYKYQFKTVVGRASDHYEVTDKLKKSYFNMMDKEIKVDILFHEKMYLNLGNIELKIINLPGHTLGDIGIIDKKNKTLILSELIFKHSRNMIIYIDDFNKYINSLEIVKNIITKEDIIRLITSHEEKIIFGKDNILKLIKYNIDYIKGLKEKIDKLHNKGYSIRKISEEICKMYEKALTPDSIVAVKSMLYQD